MKNQSKFENKSIKKARPVSYFWTKVIFLFTIIAGFSLWLSFFISSENTAKASVMFSWSHDDVDIGGDTETEYWNLWELPGYPSGMAVSAGKMTFQIKGLGSNGASQDGKRNIIGMIDRSGGENMADRNYWVQVRKRKYDPETGTNARLEVKGRLNCEWFDNTAFHSGDPSLDYDPDVWYDAWFEWNQHSVVFGLWHPDGYEIVSEAQMPIPFMASNQAIWFGAAPVSAAFPAQHAEYRDIQLDAYELVEASVLVGEKCDLSEEELYEDEGFEDEDADLGGSDSQPNDPYGKYICVGGGAENDVKPKFPEDSYSYNCSDLIDVNPLKWVLGIDWEEFRYKFSPVWGITAKDILSFFECYSEKQGATPPSVTISTSPQNIQYGDEVNVKIAANNWKTKADKLYKAFFIDNLFYNSVLAGGTLPEHSTNYPDGFASLHGDKGPACTPVTRRPEIDTDNDGMDDDWERLYFDDLSAGTWEDPDDDGYIADRFKSTENDYYITPVVPIDVPNKTGTGRTLVLLGSDDTKEALYDGMPETDDRFPNILEYIFGTNPIDGDSDGDGVGDEEDMFGTGINSDNFYFQTFKEPEEGKDSKYEVRAIVVGVNERKKISVVSAKSVLEMQRSNLEVLGVTINPSSSSVAKGEEVNIKAVARGAGNIKGASVNYEWGIVDVDGNYTPVCDQVGSNNSDTICGVGKDNWSFKIPDEAAAGVEYTIYSVATDTVTGRRAEARTKITVGESLKPTIAGCFDDGSARGCHSELPQFSACAAGENPDYVIQGEFALIRAGNAEEVTLDQNSVCTWKLDGEVQKEDSGACKQCFSNTSGGVKEDSSCSISGLVCDRTAYLLEANAVTGHVYDLELSVSDKKTGEEKAKTNAKIEVKGVESEICIDGECTPDHDTQRFNVSNSGSHSASATLRNIPKNSTYKYMWTLDGVNAKSGSCDVADCSPEDLSINTELFGLGSHDVSFKVTVSTEYGENDEIRRFFNESGVKLNIVAEGSTTAFWQKLNIMGTIADVFPDKYRIIFTIFSVTAGFSVLGFAGVVVFKKIFG